MGDLGSIPGLGRSPGEEKGDRLPTLVFWPREFHGLYSPWGHKESDTTERISLHLIAVLLPDLMEGRKEGGRKEGRKK